MKLALGYEEYEDLEFGLALPFQGKDTHVEQNHYSGLRFRVVRRTKSTECSLFFHLFAIFTLFL